MREYTVFTLQEKLRKDKFVSVPLLQMNYDVSYREARAFLEELQKMGWVSRESQGNRYPVNVEQLQMRKLQRFEIDGLIEDIDSDCVALLLLILKRRDTGLPSEDALDALDSVSQSEDTLQLLTKHRLIYLSDDAYHLRVTRQTVNVLDAVVRAKRRSEMSRRMTGREGGQTDLRKLFDPLF